MLVRVFDLPAELPEAQVLDRFRSWNARARALGGYVYRPTHRELAVVVPEGTPVRGGRPLTAFLADRRR